MIDKISKLRKENNFTYKNLTYIIEYIDKSGKKLQEVIVASSLKKAKNYFRKHFPNHTKILTVRNYNDEVRHQIAAQKKYIDELANEINSKPI